MSTAESASRRDRAASLGIVLLGLVVLLVAVAALKHPQSSQAAPATPTPHTTTRTVAPSSPTVHRSTSAPAPSSTKTSTAALPPATATPLVIMNNTTTSGLAASAESRFEAAGWTVTSIGTMSNDIISTAAYYDPAVAGAKRAALALQKAFPVIKRVVPRFPELASGPVVVVLAWDYSGS
jgi:hypothetical protein